MKTALDKELQTETHIILNREKVVRFFTLICGMTEQLSETHSHILLVEDDMLFAPNLRMSLQVLISYRLPFIQLSIPSSLTLATSRKINPLVYHTKSNKLSYSGAYLISKELLETFCGKVMLNPIEYLHAKFDLEMSREASHVSQGIHLSPGLFGTDPSLVSTLGHSMVAEDPHFDVNGAVKLC